MSQLWLRFRVRRRTSRVEPDGGPSIAVVVAGQDRRRRMLDTLADRPVHDLSSVSLVAAMLALLRRPRGLVVTDNRFRAALLRLTGNRTLTARAIADGTLQLKVRR